MVKRIQDANAFDTRTLALANLMPAGASLDHAVFDDRNGTFVAQIKEPQNLPSAGFDQFVAMGMAQQTALDGKIAHVEALLGATPEFAPPAQTRTSTATIGARRTNSPQSAERQGNGMKRGPIGASFGRKGSAHTGNRLTAQTQAFAPRRGGPKSIKEYRALETQLKALRSQATALRAQQQTPVIATNGFSPTITRTVAARAAPSSRLNTFVTNNHPYPSLTGPHRRHDRYEELNAELMAKHEKELETKAKKAKKLKAENKKIKKTRELEEAPQRRATRKHNMRLLGEIAHIQFLSMA